MSLLFGVISMHLCAKSGGDRSGINDFRHRIECICLAHLMLVKLLKAFRGIHSIPVLADIPLLANYCFLHDLLIYVSWCWVLIVAGFVCVPEAA